MHVLVVAHRWLGVAFCGLFAMWFVTGIVMHFVPFPALTEIERITGLGPVNSSPPHKAPLAAIAASNIPNPTRVRLFARGDGPVYLVQGTTGMQALHAADLSPAEVRTEGLALLIAVDHAHRHNLAVTAAAVAELADYDQWTVSNGLDPHRPLFRVVLHDQASTELYVSSATGEVVRDTTGHERRWNYAGSVLHWIYPSVLRRHWGVWDGIVWALSLWALIAALAGAVLGTLRLHTVRGRLTSPYRGWHAWHHWLGLGCMIFLLMWIFSGWLSMDHGRLFSTGKLTPAESAAFATVSDWRKLASPEMTPVSVTAREIEWFKLDDRIYRRERLSPDTQTVAGTPGETERAFLQSAELASIGAKLGRNCRPAVAVTATDVYPVTTLMPGAPVYRIVCGEAWFHIDGANGAALEKLDASRRAYRWLFQAAHTLDFPALTNHATLRTILIVFLCTIGAGFSVTAVVIGWRRLRQPFKRR